MYFADLDTIAVQESTKGDYQDDILREYEEEAEESDSGRDLRRPHVTHFEPLRQVGYGEELSWVLDAKSIGNVGRFFNHSCEPNCAVQVISLVT